VRGAHAEVRELSLLLAAEGMTEALGRRIGADVRSGDVILLEGDLGAGKTTLVRGVHEGMGCLGRVRSPSFATLIEYDGATRLHHFDLFRYEHAGEAFLDEFGEWLHGDAVSILEWSERLEAGALDAALRVRLDFAGEARRASLCGRPERWRVLGSESGARS